MELFEEFVNLVRHHHRGGTVHSQHMLPELVGRRVGLLVRDRHSYDEAGQLLHRYHDIEDSPAALLHQRHIVKL
jgi:hypothetical protein